MPNIRNKKARNRNSARNINKDLKSLNNWPLASKISLNSAKTEIIFLRKNQTQLPNIIIKLDGVKLSPSSVIK